MAFKMDRTTVSGTPFVTLDKNGKARFNLEACRKYNLYDYTSVVCYFDSDKNRIGFKRTNSGAEKYRRALTTMAGGLKSVSIIGLLRHNNVPKRKTKSVRYKLYEEHGFLCIDLNKELGNDNSSTEEEDRATW